MIVLIVGEVISINTSAKLLNTAERFFNFLSQNRQYGLVVVSVLIIGSGILVYSTGGIKYVFSHSMYLPILLCAMLFGAKGGIIAGLVGGIILGPLMPVDTITGEMQLAINWIFRSIFFMLIGGVVGQTLSMLETRTGSLRKNEQEFRSIFEFVAVGIIQVDPQKDQTIRFNDKYCEITGYSETELLNIHFHDLTHPEDRQQDWEIFSKAMRGETSHYSNEKRYIRKDGTIIWVRMNAAFIKDEAGNPLRTVAVCEDITDRKQAEVKIISQNEALKSLYSLVTSMRTAPTTDDLITIILSEACRLLEADDGSVTLLSRDRKFFTIVKAQGLWAEQVGYRFPVTEGLFSIVLQTGEPYFTDDYSTEEKELHFLDQAEKAGPMLLVPLKTETEISGVLEVSRRRNEENRHFTADDIELLSAIGEIAGNALRRQSLFDSAQNRLKQLQGLHTIDKAITGSLDLNRIFDVILNEVTSLLNLDAAAILRFDHKTGIIEYSAVRGFLFEKVPQLELRRGKGYAGRAVKEKKLIEIPNLKKVKKDPAQGPLLEEESFVTYYAVPLITKGYVQGVLEVYRREEQELDQEWLNFLKTLAWQTAIAIDNADLFQNMETANLELIQAYDATIEGWAYALDLKDEKTEEHSQRVTRLTLRIAKRMNIKKEELPHIRRGILLHDIGKMGIPDSILLKPGPLTEGEWVIMRRHPVYAYEILANVDYLRPALEIPYCHHEKWDGSGYPRGLKEEEIPLPARIFAVVDVYDALTSDRPYRKAWSEEDALTLIKKDSGSHFDPEVVEVFLKEIKS